MEAQKEMHSNSADIVTMEAQKEMLQNNADIVIMAAYSFGKAVDRDRNPVSAPNRKKDD